MRQREDGKWEVGEKVFDTNEEAWREVDRMENQVMSPVQKLAEYRWSRSVDEAFNPKDYKP